tara:strand:+ start:340 stop:519 length:180 start_codon:yes stop_codon:yes gene_type:complete
MKYTNIKRELRRHVNNNIRSLWTFDEEENVITQIYQNYSNNLKIYTPKQLIDRLNEISM